jgi:MOSC domain-containing protein YiiM
MSPRSKPAARLEAIWLKRGRGGPMDPVERAEVDERGLVGSSNRGGRRAVTIIEREVFDRLRVELDPTVAPVMRRAGLMISGLRLEETRGQLLAIGPVRIRIGGETRPCETMDEEGSPGLRAALRPHWGGGVFGRVEQCGFVSVGDAVRFV